MKRIDKSKWVWMPHAGHYICSGDCRFVLCTYVDGFIVSTVGEMWNDRRVREIHAKIYDPVWYESNRQRLGDDFDRAYFDKFGWGEIGVDSTYETMVFKAKRSKNKCCKYVVSDYSGLEQDRYNNAEDAYKGHMKMCKKYSINILEKKNEK